VRAGAVPHIFGKLSTRAKTLLRLHHNQRFAQEITGLQIVRSPNFGNFKIFNLGVSGQNDIWV